MKRLLTLPLIFCLACDESADLLSPLPVLEVHYNFETGQKIGKRILGYDAAGRLISEYYYSAIDPISDIEVLYEYDSDGNLLTRKERNPNGDNIFFITELTYDGGQKKTETTFFENSPMGYRTLYFFTGNRMDSTESYAYSSFEQEYRYSSTTYYAYEAAKIIRAFSNNGGETVYRYSETLSQVCNLYPGDNGATIEDCTVTVFDGRGLLAEVFHHVYDTESGSQHSQILEDFYYGDGRLQEKRVYSYPAYDPGNTIDVKLIKYKY